MDTTDILLFGLKMSRGYTNDEVAERAQMKVSHYTRLERDEIKMTVDDAGKLAEVYNLEPEYFFTNPAKIVNQNSGPHSVGIIYASTYSVNSEPELLKQIESLKNELNQLRNNKG
jgi:transcriptional regulator with XRE-family HTH domain